MVNSRAAMPICRVFALPRLRTSSSLRSVALLLVLIVANVTFSSLAQLSAPVSDEAGHVSVDGNKFLLNHATLDPQDEEEGGSKSRLVRMN